MDHVVEKTLRSPINHLLLLLHSSHNQTFSLFSFTFLLLLCLSHYMSLCVSRASIVQKRVIYFQDEGSLTVQLCEKGNNSYPSSLSFHSWLRIMLLVSCALRVVYPPSVFGAHYLPLFHTIFKKISNQQSQLGKIVRTTNPGCHGNLNIAFCFAAEPSHCFHATCDFIAEKNGTLAS